MNTDDLPGFASSEPEWSHFDLQPDERFELVRDAFRISLQYPDLHSSTRLVLITAATVLPDTDVATLAALVQLSESTVRTHLRLWVRTRAVRFEKGRVTFLGLDSWRAHRGLQ